MNYRDEIKIPHYKCIQCNCSFQFYLFVFNK